MPKFTFYLTFSGSMTTPRTYKNRPNLAYDEISMRLSVNLPDALFKKPQLSAEINVPETAAQPTEISADVQENVRLAIEESTGMEVKITFPETETT